jgi:hypothetical protein
MRKPRPALNYRYPELQKLTQLKAAREAGRSEQATPEPAHHISLKTA